MDFQITSRPGKRSDESEQSSSARWFERLTTAGTPLLRLFCFPYAGGNAQVFRKWQRDLPAQVEVCLVHLPGRDRRMSERPFTRLQPLVQAVADALVPEIDSQYVFYGHSMGALISFELARELRRRNLKLPVHLFVSGRRAPSVPETEPPIFHLPPREFIAEIKRLNGTPSEFFEHAELQELILPLLRADFEIVDTYEYASEAPLACPITVYGGEQDGRVPIESLTAWKKQTSTKYNLRMLSGGHFFIESHKIEFIKTFVDDLKAILPGSC
ncbi:MAG TPA: alpha/beta fold hydrolase [Candidatus Angelobacter sp.]|jgi:medium-chain acyl-[acyl-carrier-protein] hydrolase